MTTVAGDGVANAGLSRPQSIALLHHNTSTATFAIGEGGFRTLTVTDTGVTTAAQLTTDLITADAVGSEPIGIPKPLWALIAGMRLAAAVSVGV